MKSSIPLPVRSGIASLAATALLAAGCGEDTAAEQAPPETQAQAAEISAAGEKAVAGYRRFAIENARNHLARFRDFAAAIEAGDLETAKRIYPVARMPWERIEPIAGLFGDLDPALDAREGDAPPATWGGWHYFEKALWIDRSTEGLKPYIAETEADARTLIEAAETVQMGPVEVATGAIDLLGEVSASKITGEEERYSHTDLYDFQANVEGSRAAFEAVEPLLPGAERGLANEIARRFARLQETLDTYRTDDGFVSYTEVSQAERRELSRQIDALGEPLSLLASRLET